MFHDIDFMKLQNKLRDNKQFDVEIYVASNIFECRLSEYKLGVNGELLDQEQSDPVIMSSKELAAWIEPPAPIGDSIRLLRLRAGRNQGEMARVIGCSTSTWSGYEVGRTDIPEDVIAQIKNYFDWDGSPVERTKEEILRGEELRQSIESIFI